MTLVWGAYDLIQSFPPLYVREAGTDLLTYVAILSMNAFVYVAALLPCSRLLRSSPISAPAAGFLMAAAYSAGGGVLSYVSGKAQDRRMPSLYNSEFPV